MQSEIIWVNTPFDAHYKATTAHMYSITNIARDEKCCTLLYVWGVSGGGDVQCEILEVCATLYKATDLSKWSIVLMLNGLQPC